MIRWLALCLLLAGGAEAACRQALALGLDVSGSVDQRDYRLQLNGLAGALQDPDVVQALLAMPQAPVHLAVFEWSGPEDQRLILSWTPITSETDIAAIAARLTATTRRPAELSTAIGSAERYGAALLAQQAVCWRRVLDLSGDGMSNTGPHPRDVTPPDITINGLVIGTDMAADRENNGVAELGAYYRAYVLQGRNAFVETALGFEDFEAAMRRKLLRELQVLAVSQR